MSSEIGRRFEVSGLGARLANLRVGAATALGIEAEGGVVNITNAADALGLPAPRAISHAHYDHVGNCRLFRKAKWVAQKSEYDAMFGPNPEGFGYIPELYATMRENTAEIVEGDHDLFGDGAVRFDLRAGAYAGPLLIRLPDSGPV